MTFEQAKEFFREYNGLSFHMHREEPEKAAQFDALNISDEQKDQWRLEMANEYLDKINCDDPRCWSRFSTLTSILASIKSFKDKQEDMFIKAIEKQIGCDEMSRTISLETICGRSYDYHDGVIAFFRKNHYDVRRLKEVTDRFIGSDNNQDDARFRKALTLYKSLII